MRTDAKIYIVQGPEGLVVADASLKHLMNTVHLLPKDFPVRSDILKVLKTGKGFTWKLGKHQYTLSIRQLGVIPEKLIFDSVEAEQFAKEKEEENLAHQKIQEKKAALKKEIADLKAKASMGPLEEIDKKMKENK